MHIHLTFTLKYNLHLLLGEWQKEELLHVAVCTV